MNEYSKGKINGEVKNILIAPLRIIAQIAAISGLIVLLFEVKYFEAYAREVYVTRIAASAVAFLVLVISNLKLGEKYALILLHFLLASLIVSYGIIIFMIPQTIIFNSFILGLILFTVAMFLSWDVKNQIIVTIYFNIVFASSILFNTESFYFFPNGLEASIFVLFMSVMTIVASFVNYDVRKKNFPQQQLLQSGNNGTDYKDMFENAADGMFQSTPEGKFKKINPAMVRLLGYSTEAELLKVNISSDVYVDSADRKNVQRLLEKHGKVKNYRVKLRKKDLTEITARLNCRLINDPNELPLYFEGSLQDITNQVNLEKERKEALEELKLKKRDADKNADHAIKTSNIKTQFLANMSHEIRTPMNSVLGFLTLIGNGLYDGEAELKEFSSNARMSAESLLDIINNILDISKIEAGKMELDLHSFNIREEILKATSIIQPSIKGKGLDFTYKVDEAIPEIIKGDSTRYRQIILNLLSNSVKFTDIGKISLIVNSLESDTEKMKIITYVSDTGCGMSENQIQNLFQPYTQVREEKDEKQGAGLGLMICKEFLNIMGGEIKVESKVGKGTIFKVIINFDLVEGNGNVSCLRGEGEFGAEPDGDKSEAEIFNVQRTSKSTKRILLVEDNPISQKVELKILREVGYNVDAVSNGFEAIKAFQTNSFSLILMDVEMQDMDGITTTKKIREIEGSLNRIPIIAVTAHSSMKDRQRCINSGMDDYISKPININFLKMTIDQWLYNGN